MPATIYLNLEDDLAKIVTQLKREKASELVLVCPKGSYIFSESINLRLLKKKIDMLGKTVSILTMDSKGQAYAREAGFDLKYMPKTKSPGALSDIRPARKPSFSSSSQSKAPKVVAKPSNAVVPVRTNTNRTSILSNKIAKPSRRIGGLGTIKTKTVISTAPVATVRGPDNLYVSKEFSANKVKQKSAKPKRKATTWLVSLVGLGLIASLVAALFVLPSAKITVYGKSQTIARDVDINLDVKVEQPDSTSLSMPAVPFDENPDTTVTIESTGKKEIGSKAEGQVSIFNLTGQPINLKASTTVLTIGSKRYLFLDDQNNIRPVTSATDERNATIARVIAIEGGESYNAPSQTRMEITNEAFGAQPQRLFAKASTQILGGNSRYLSVVSEEDIKNGQQQTKDKLMQIVKDKLSEQNLILLDNASTLATSEFIPDKPAGTESPTVTVQGRLRITGLAFDETILREILRSRIEASLTSGRKLQPLEQDEISYKVRNMDLANGTLGLSIQYQTQAKLDLDAGSLGDKILGKSKQEASEVLLSNEAIEKVEILLKPSWQRNTPLFKSKIDIVIQE